MFTLGPGLRGGYVPGIPPAGTTKLLCHFDGTNGDVTTSDSAGQLSTPAMTRGGTAVISSAEKVFGATSSSFDGSNDQWRTINLPADNALFQFTGDFTIEMWVRFRSAVALQFFAGIDTGAPNIYFALQSSNSKIVVRCFTLDIEALNASVQDRWYHVALTRKSGVARFFVDGLIQGSGAESTSGAAARFQMGGSVAGATTNWLNGYIDECRVVNGFAVYTQNFAVPTAPFTA